MNTNVADASETQSMITDFAGNVYPASRLSENESPSFDVHGARRDQAYEAFGRMCNHIADQVAQVGDVVRLNKVPRKHKTAKGQTGTVIWKGHDNWAPDSRYNTSIQKAMLASMGQGYRIGVKLDDATVVWMSAYNPQNEAYEVLERPDPKVLHAQQIEQYKAKRARIEADIARIRKSQGLAD